MQTNMKRKLTVVIVLIVAIVVGLASLIHMQQGPKKTVVQEKKPVASAPSNTGDPTIESLGGSSLPEPCPCEKIEDLLNDDSLLRIITKEHPIAKDYVPSELVEVEGVDNLNHQKLRKDAAEALIKMFQAAKEEGINLKLVSGYRDYDLQVSLWNTYINKYGYALTNRMDEHPGRSEHQLGLAADIGSSSGSCELMQCFANSKEYQWLHENAYKYGFIERYPVGKESETGIMYSPWHFRYIGSLSSKEIYESGLTMEEFYKELLEEQ